MLHITTGGGSGGGDSPTDTMCILILL